ncbi:hypothetical protein QA942_19750 [Streptomyces sp. B21-106]|uniref:hypothetical protein n=1 Tax=Streptomyces sp. B21-106 TaxID=3039418 RepID=UPI002FF1B93A
MTDPDPLRKRIAHAIHRYDQHHALSGNDIPSRHHFGEADFVLAELRTELDALNGPEPAPVHGCTINGQPAMPVLVAEYNQLIARADHAEARADRLAQDLSDAETTVAQVHALYEQWVKAGPPPLGTSMSRWWDRRLVELHKAIQPPAHNADHPPAPAATEATGP